MNEIRKLVTVILGMAIGVGTMVLVMIYGWGLEPQNWWWIVGGSIGGQILGHLFVAIGTAKD